MACRCDSRRADTDSGRSTTAQAMNDAELQPGWLERVVMQARIDLLDIPVTSLPAWFRRERA